ncbi:MAG: hypothetical protein ACKOX6_16145 [Bdellovibrio sp.]
MKKIVVGFIVATLLGGTIFVSKKYLLFSEEDSESLGRPLAVIREIQNEVRHKNSGDFFWKTSAEGKKVYEGSQIFVGPKSSSLLVFTENYKARLKAETLIRISRNNEVPNLITLSLNDGGFNLKNGSSSTSPIVLNLEDGSFKVDGKNAYDLHIQKNSGKLSLALASGKINLEGVRGVKDLEAGKSVIVKEKQLSQTENGKKVELFVEELPAAAMKLLAPGDGEIIRSKEEPILLKWVTDQQNTLHLQYSSDPDFTENFKEVDVTSQNFFPVLPKDLRKDTFWRLVAYIDGVPHFSKISFFKFGDSETVTLQSSPLIFVRKGHWKYEAEVLNKETGTNYEFQVSRNSEFSDIFDAFVGQPPFSSLLDTPGDFYVRVRKSYGKGLFSGWSATDKVTIRPELSVPQLELADRKEDTVGNVIAQVRWNQVPNSIEYTLQSSDSPEFKKPSNQKSVKDLSTFTKQSGSQKYYYRVFAKSAEGEISPPSNILVIEGSSVSKLAAQEDTANKQLTASGSIKNLSTDDINAKLLIPLDGTIFYVGDKIHFEWDPFFLNSSLEVSKVQNFSQDVERFDAKGTTSLNISTTNRLGKYYWRLAYSYEGKPQLTKTQTFTVSEAISTQIEKLTLRFMDRNKWELNFKIKDSKEQEEFIFQASLDSNFQKVEYELAGTLGKKIIISKPGSYFVRARRNFGSAKNQNWSNVVTLFVRPPLETPVLARQEEVLASPEVISIKLAWSDVKYAAQYNVDIADTPKFGNIKKTVKVPANTYTIEHSEKQISYLRVTAISAEGERSQSSNIFKLKGLLPGPSIEKYEIAFADLDKKQDTDKLHIIWDHRKNTQKYFVEISRTEDLKKTSIHETRNIEFYTPVPEPGWYYFRVRPESDNADFIYTPTTVFAVEYKKLDALSAAKFDSPRDGESFAFNKGNYRIQFRWGQTLGAGWYDLEFSKTKSFSDSKTYKVEARDFLLRQGLSEGQWFYRLRGRNPNQASPWSETQSLILK